MSNGSFVVIINIYFLLLYEAQPFLLEEHY